MTLDAMAPMSDDLTVNYPRSLSVPAQPAG